MANYITGEELTREIILYKSTGKISEELGRMILLIAKRLSCNGRWSGYTWKEDMIGEGVLTVIKYVKNFDPTRENANSFAYVTQICWNAFLTYCNKQRKHAYIKSKCYQGKDVLENSQEFTMKGIDYNSIVNIEPDDEKWLNYISVEEKK